MKTENGTQVKQENNANSGGGSAGAGAAGDRDRDRRNRGARATRFTDADNAGGGGGTGRERSRERPNCRVYISNIPYDFRWQDLKDLFRRMVGSVEYVELFYDENCKARGCGIVEFKDPENVKNALEVMNRYELNGRELVVKEDHGEQRDQYGRIIRDGPGGGAGGGNVGGGGNRGNNLNLSGGGVGDRDFFRRDDERSGRNNFNMMSNDFNNSSSYNYYGLSASFLESLGINGPLHNKVFVANLDYKVDSKKLKQVFKLAGKVQSVDLSVDKDGNSRGFAVVEYDHPVEAVQAISMLDRQMLYDRRMTVRLDRIPDKGEGVKLPDGLGGIGIGLGANGEPLRDVARNLPNQQQNQTNLGSNQSQQQGGGMLGNMVSNMGAGSVGGGGGGGFNNAGVQPAPVMAPVQSSKSQANLLSNTGPGGLNLNNLSSSNLAALGAALSNPLLSNSLSSLGLNVSSLAGNDDTLSSNNASLSNNYSTGGNNYSSGFGGSSSYTTGSGNAGGGGGVGGFNAYNSGAGVGNDVDFKPGNLDLFGNVGNLGGGGVPNVGGGGGNGAGSGARKSDTVIIKNLPLSCTWQTLRDKFRDVGEVKFAEIRGNDVGVVRFFKERDAELAIALMDGSRIDNRSISVQFF